MVYKTGIMDSDALKLIPTSTFNREGGGEKRGQAYHITCKREQKGGGVGGGRGSRKHEKNAYSIIGWPRGKY